MHRLNCRGQAGCLKLRAWGWVLLALMGLASWAGAYPEWWQWHWDPPLTGREMLVELEHRTGKQPRGIYALDVDAALKGEELAVKVRPRLLIPEGERPVWSPKRTYFVYAHTEYLRIVHREKMEDAVLEVPVYFNDRRALDPPVFWSWREDGFALHHLGLRGLQLALVGPGTGFYERGYAPAGEYSLLHGGTWGVPGSSPCMAYPTFSPDGRYLATERYPLGPWELGRSQSRIWVDEILPPEARPQGPTSTKEGEPYIDPLFKDQGRRLTQVDHLTELRPMWSPTGEWIAFTGADLGTGVVCPYVCRPDGGELTRLLEKSQFTNQLGSSNWKELGGLPEDASLFPSFAVEWSPDGRMLLLNQGGPYAGIDVAWWDGTRWLGRALGGYASSHSAIRWVAFGPDGKWVAYVDGGASDYEERIVLHRTEHGGEGSGRFLDLPAGWRILWFDW